MLNNLFFGKLCRLKENFVKYGRKRGDTDENIILFMYFTYGINKATEI
jgi:hypothetical protein